MYIYGSVSLEKPDSVVELACQALLIVAACVPRETQLQPRGPDPAPQEPVLPLPIPRKLSA